MTFTDTASIELRTPDGSFALLEGHAFPVASGATRFHARVRVPEAPYGIPTLPLWALGLVAAALAGFGRRALQRRLG
ncbi:hypothetical protein BST95_14635 [Halioglobus japonicus]|uniref:IPTL-CTERM sorting domain-containing protein n=1 Tax=Halioglobus japonicus TaxID=930805 RepID=A0AAP8SPY6_9GAMM|nr:IPTL-CTERM sorting domain-containing protein [Halioglobus japonicus]AQA19298.1 hypothetical protein BST95_14635 [Halioglobus japonicus]PLW87663.1 IPTL-CTERM sorting domain-containing protein [Halioglobus japonicus]GHD07238.1 hypothetical protein GCM10007052_02840 [Halioglobus japonicus]